MQRASACCPKPFFGRWIFCTKPLQLKLVCTRLLGCVQCIVLPCVANAGFQAVSSRPPTILYILVTRIYTMFYLQSQQSSVLVLNEVLVDTARGRVGRLSPRVRHGLAVPQTLGIQLNG